MDTSTFDPANFNYIDSSGGATLDSVAAGSTDDIAELTLSAAPEDTDKIVVSKNLKDKAGNVLSSVVTYTFSISEGTWSIQK